MEKTVKSCGECPFLDLQTNYCNHPDGGFYVAFRVTFTATDKDCPEGGQFVITTKKLDNDKSNTSKQ